MGKLSASDNQIKTLLFGQFFMVVISPVLVVPFGFVTVKSAFLAALIVFLASLIVKSQIFRNYSAQHPEKILASFYGAVITKTVFMILAMLVILTQLQPINFAIFFAVIFLTHLLPSLLTAAWKRN